jgi:hypothetical protein
MLREYERTEGTMTAAQGVSIIDRYMTKIETTARDFNIYESKNLRQASLAASKMDQAQANAFYSVIPAPAPAPSPAPGPAPGPSPAPSPKKSPTAAVSEKPEGKGDLTCNHKTCDKKVAKMQCDKFKKVKETRPDYAPPVCWDCWKGMMAGEGKNDLELKTPVGGKIEYAKCVAAFNRKKGSRQAALVLEATYGGEDDRLNEIMEFQEKLYEEAKANPESAKLEQLRKISAMIGAEKKRIVSAVSQQTESIEFGDFGREELTETQEQYDMYLEGMSYPSG